MPFKYKYIKNWNRTFSVFDILTAINKCIRYSFWAFSLTEMTDFPPLLHTSTREISTLSQNWTEPTQIGQYSEYSGSSRKRTPTGREKDVRNWSWPGLRECKNTEFVWELRKKAFCEGGHKQSFPLTRVSVRRASKYSSGKLFHNRSTKSYPCN